MIKREVALPARQSFFLFGPRQTGKSTLIRSTFPSAHARYYDLLKSSEYLRFSENPSLFREEVEAREKNITHVIVDEVQRIPELLNEVHSLLGSGKTPYFVLSGSSARKLKRSHANLLAGRAWTYHLYPLTCEELGGLFSLEKALRWGTLPSVYLSEREEDRREILRSYVETYLKEEVEQEALVRNLGGFLRFLTLAADENGNVINYSNIARETGNSYNTVKEYFQILEDTLIGFILLPYSKAVRKRLIKHPKFYFFDTGVHRAVAKKLQSPLERKTSDYGRAFEHFLIGEITRLDAYKKTDYRFSFYHSSTHAEVDLILETPRGGTYAIEIKSTESPDRSSLTGLKSFLEICPNAHAICACLGSHRRLVDGIEILPWQSVLQVIGLRDSGSPAAGG